MADVNFRWVEKASDVSDKIAGWSEGYVAVLVALRVFETMETKFVQQAKSGWNLQRFFRLPIQSYC